MDLTAQIRDFLTTRRARLTLADVGLPNYGGRRQVAGLRREEVASLASVAPVSWSGVRRGWYDSMCQG